MHFKSLIMPPPHLTKPEARLHWPKCSRRQGSIHRSSLLKIDCVPDLSLKIYQSDERQIVFFKYSLNFLNNPCCMVILQMAFWSFMLPIPCKSIGCWRALVKSSISLSSYRICAGPEGGAQSFPKNYNMTIGVDFLVKRVSCLRR